MLLIPQVHAILKELVHKAINETAVSLYFFDDLPSLASSFKCDQCIAPLFPTGAEAVPFSEGGGGACCSRIIRENEGRKQESHSTASRNGMQLLNCRFLPEASSGCRERRQPNPLYF